MIEVKNLCKSFLGQPAVSDISFKIDEGKTLVLLGTSGCGKTTTLKMINRLIKPDSGVIRINGNETLNQEIVALRRSIGYVIQETGLFPHYTVEENIALVPGLLKWDSDKIHARIAELINLLRIPEDQFLTKYPHELSGGQKQRVGIARALAADPPIILMDEPFGALDPITRVRIRKEIKALFSILNKTVLMVTHDIPEAMVMADTVCLMDNGKVVQQGTPKDLIFNPENEFVKEFMKEDRFQLEMEVLKWGDLPISQNDDRFDMNSSVLDILKQLDQDGNMSLYEEIFKAFNQSRRKLMK